MILKNNHYSLFESFVSVFSHVWVLHDVIGFEFSVGLGFEERSIGVLGDLRVSGLFEGVIVDKIVDGGWTLVDNILSVFKSHGESFVNLFLRKVKWVKTGWDRSSWGNNVSEVCFLVSEFGSQESVH